MLKIAKQIQSRIKGQKQNAGNAQLRAVAAAAVCKVIYQKHSLRQVLKSHVEKSVSKASRPLFKELCFGTIRHFLKLEAIVNEVLNHPLEEKHRDLLALMCIGIYQLSAMSIKPYAAVNETVAATRELKKPWASKLVNKVLRTYTRKKDKLEKVIKTKDNLWYSHPEWLISKIKHDWPENWQDILSASNEKPPLSLRINKQKTSVAGYLELLKVNHIPAHGIEHFPDAVIIESPMPAEKLPGFEHGLCSVQDLAGQKIIELLELAPNQTVLDACAAPGSKTCHILESQPDIKRMVAMDIDAERLLRVKDNIERLQLPIDTFKMVLEDATHTKEWWDGTHFDRILLDAPCSATGVIRRHPDIKALRQENDINKQSQLQGLLLKTLWPLLAEGGLLLYTTCSYLREENEKVIAKFLNEHPKAKVQKIHMEPALPQKHGVQMLPTNGGPDGFYYCVIKK